MVTFLVCGLWHGANWTFIVWGVIHALLQIIEKFLGIAPKGKYYNQLETLAYLKPIRILVTFVLVNFAWIFFRIPTINDACKVVTRIFVDFGGQTVLDKATNSDKILV